MATIVVAMRSIKIRQVSSDFNTTPVPTSRDGRSQLTPNQHPQQPHQRGVSLPGDAVPFEPKCFADEHYNVLQQAIHVWPMLTYANEQRCVGLNESTSFMCGYFLDGIEWV